MTAWTAPRTFVTNELVTASMLNSNLRDNTLNLWERFDTTTGHDHDGSDSAKLDWDAVWADAVHTHASAAEGGTLDWDNVWADAVHTHTSAAEGGTLTGIGYFQWNYWHPTLFTTMATGTNLSYNYRPKMTVTFTEAEITLITAPTGADFIVDINKDGTSLWDSNQANRPTIAAGATVGESVTFDTATAAEDTLLTMDIDQIGSSNKGAYLTVVLWYTYTLS